MQNIWEHIRTLSRTKNDILGDRKSKPQSEEYDGHEEQTELQKWSRKFSIPKVCSFF